MSAKERLESSLKELKLEHPDDKKTLFDFILRNDAIMNDLEANQKKWLSDMVFNKIEPLKEGKPKKAVVDDKVVVTESNAMKFLSNFIRYYQPKNLTDKVFLNLILGSNILMKHLEGSISDWLTDTVESVVKIIKEERNI